MTASVLVFLDLDSLTPGELEEWCQTLSDADRARADRFGSRRRRCQFIAGRHLLTLLIRDQLGVVPTLSTAASGAVHVEGVALHCGIAHSGCAVMVGIDRYFSLGVDIEQLQERRFDVLANHYFHPREAAVLAALAAEQKSTDFYRLWTRKEAAAKAGGTGLTLAAMSRHTGREDGLAFYTTSLPGFMATCATGGEASPRWLRASFRYNRIVLTALDSAAPDGPPSWGGAGGRPRVSFSE